MSSLLKDRSAKGLSLHPEDAATLQITEGSNVKLKMNDQVFALTVRLSSDQPKGRLLVTRNGEVPITKPEAVEIIADHSDSPASGRGEL